MLYTIIHPSDVADRVHLFPDIDSALARSGDGLVYTVAVLFDQRCRLLGPTRPDVLPLGPTWTTPAELHGDGSVTAKGPIPGELYTSCLLPAPVARPGPTSGPGAARRLQPDSA
jgi:hypothetical protein